MLEDCGVDKNRPFSARRLVALTAALALAACGSFGPEGPTPEEVVTPPQAAGAAPAAVIGDGSVTVAMLLPISAGGSASGLAQSFENAARLAMDEVTADAIRIVVRDDGGDTDVARLAAEASIAEGATLVLGPVFAPAVTGASEAARPAGVPIIAFSTDASVAGNGVYLLSFLPRQDASRIVSYAASQGVTAFAALVPDDGYGLVMEAAFREAVASAGARAVAVERYQPGGVAQAAANLSGRGAFEAVFVPNGGDDPAAAAAALRDARITTRLLGSGQWDSPDVIASPLLAGAWYPAPAKGGFDAFAARYQARFSVSPPRTASLVYDAALLANGLVAARGPGAFGRDSLETVDGFLGVDGVFRLTSAGLSERGLAVYEIGNGTSAVVSPAPARFGAPA
jgi:ABC-type branched-subunit amino acid transport system substrate-binding protein